MHRSLDLIGLLAHGLRNSPRPRDTENKSTVKMDQHQNFQQQQPPYYPPGQPAYYGTPPQQQSYSPPAQPSGYATPQHAYAPPQPYLTSQPTKVQTMMDPTTKDWSIGWANPMGFVLGSVVACAYVGDAAYAFRTISRAMDTEISGAFLAVFWALGFGAVIAALTALVFMLAKPVNRRSTRPVFGALPVWFVFVVHVYSIIEPTTHHSLMISMMAPAFFASLWLYLVCSYNQHQIAFVRPFAFYHFSPPN